MLSRIAALLPLCSHVRVLVSAARPKESSFLQGLRFNGDGTTFNPFGTVNIGGTTIIDATGGVGTYTSHLTARAPCQSPTAQALTSTSDRVHSSFGSSRLREVLL